MGGTLDVLQRRYLGIAWTRDGVRLAPALPEELGCVRLAFRFRGLTLEAEAEGAAVRLRSVPSNPRALPVDAPDGDLDLSPGRQLTVPSTLRPAWTGERLQP